MKQDENLNFNFNFDEDDKKDSAFKGLLNTEDKDEDSNVMVKDEEDDESKDIEVDEKGNETEEEHIEKSESILNIESGLGVTFSNEQMDIVNHDGSPMGVVSCAGSGKTTILVVRMLYRELELGIKPLNMLSITFNAEAEDDMKEQYYELREDCGIKNNGRPTFKTFHALFLMLLRSMSKYKNVRVENGNKFSYKLSKYVKGAEESDKPVVVEQMFSLRGNIINKGISLNGIENINGVITDKEPFTEENYIEIMKKYEDMKKEEGVIDFDDMQTLLHREIFEKGNKDPIKAFQRVWGNGDVYMDEYQDISRIQRDIMDALIKDYNRLTVIGDDDQAIYSFRGSDPQYILDFKYTYNQAIIKYLSTNYRCGSEILEQVKPVIEKNKNRMDKEIQAFNEGGHVEYIEVEKDNTPLVDEILSEVKDLDEMMYQDIAILVRNNSQRMLLTDELIENDIPINIKNRNFSLQKNNFYNGLLDVIEMIQEEDNTLFTKHFKKIFKHLGKEMVDKYKYSDKSWYEDVVNLGYYKVKNSDKQLIKQIHDTNNMLNAFVWAWKLVRGYYKFLGEKGFGSFKKTEETMKYLLKIAKGYKIDEYMEKEERKYSLLKVWEGSDEALEINTIHSVKGLEFSSVYLVGLNEDIIPDENRYEKIKEREGDIEADKYIEEERRLFYVGWTRAIDRLVVSYDKNRPSKFIKELYETE